MTAATTTDARPPGEATDAGDRLDRGVWIIASVVVVGAVMSILDTTIVNVALQTLSHDLHSPLSTIQWVVTGYLLALATVIPLTGWAAERYGAKRVWMTSVVLFSAGSALCGLAQSAEMLIVSRVLQGFGGGMLMPVGMIMLTQAAGPSRVGRVMSVVGVPMLLGPVLGPVLGGLIVDNLSWRWVFYVNLPLGAVGLVMGARLLPRAKRGARVAFDRLGVVLLSPGLALVVFGLSETESHGGFGATVVWGPIAAGLLLIAAFVAHARRATSPLIDLSLFARPEFSAAALTTFLIGAALFGGMILLPLYFQLARGEDALEAGLLLAPQGLGAALTMPIAGRLTDRLGGGKVVIAGLVLLCIGTLPFTQVTGETSYVLLIAASFVRGFGLSGSMMPAMAAAYAVLDHAAVPRATSALNVIQRVGGSVGTAILAVVLQVQITDALPGARGAGTSLAASMPAAVRQRVAEPLSAAFAHTFWWSLAMTAAALVPALLLTRVTATRRRAEPGEAAGAGAAADAGEHVGAVDAEEFAAAAPGGAGDHARPGERVGGASSAGSPNGSSQTAVVDEDGFSWNWPERGRDARPAARGGSHGTERERSATGVD